MLPISCIIFTLKEQQINSEVINKEALEEFGITNKTLVDFLKEINISEAKFSPLNFHNYLVNKINTN